MALNYVTDGPWGTGKGAPLNADEFDANTYEIQQRLEALENNPPVANSIESISQSGGQLYFHMTNGDIFGPFTMPIAVFQERGSWRAGRDYRALDTVRVGGQGRFLILKDHHSEAPFDPDRQIAGGNVYYLLSEDGIIFGDDVTESRDLTEADVFRYKMVTGDTTGDPVQITIPEESTDAPWNAGDTATYETDGVMLEILADSAVELRCSALPQSRTNQGSVVSLLYHGNDVWTVTGDLAIA